MFLDHCYTFGSLLWPSSLKKHFLEEAPPHPPVTYFRPALDPPLGRSGQNTLMHVRCHEHFIPTKFHKHPSSSSVVMADFVFRYIYMQLCNPIFLHLNKYINKRPKGPHIVHLSTMCHLFDRSARAVIFIYSSDWKTQLGRRCWDLASCQISLNPVQQFQRRSQKCLSQSWAMAAIFFIPIGPKKTDLVKDVEILLAVKFRRILFSGFREEVENVSANQRLGRPSCFSDQPKKHKLGRRHWDLASCQVSLNSVQRFQRSRKCLSQSEARAAIFFFSDWPEKHKLGRGHCHLASCQVSLNSVQRFQRRSRKCLSQSEAGAAILFFRSAQKTQTW